MQEKCKNGRRGTNCSFPHPNMCFHFICQGNKGCNKGASCQYAHPKLCQASLTSKRCDRCNCYYYHVAGTLRPLTEARPTQHKNELVPLQKQLNSQPTLLMQVDVTPPYNTLPSTHMQTFIPEHTVSNLPPNIQVSVPLEPPNQPPSNELTIF